MSIKKTVRAVNLPGVHPGLMDRIAEAEKAELEGEMPRQLDGVQKVTRPSVDATTADRIKQVRTIGLVQAAHLVGVDPRDELASTPGYMPGVDLDQVWDSLSENQKIRAGAIERFRLEMDTALRHSGMAWKAPHQIGGRLDARNLERSEENLLAEIESFAYLLADDSRALLESFVESTRKLIQACLRQNAVAGIDAPALHEILRDWAQKLIYQELSSRRRAMGDRGIRRICANIELADQAYAKLKRNPDFSPRTQLLMRLIHIHQDIGFTAYAARTSYRGSKLHRAYGARIFTDELNRYRTLFTHDELEMARFAVATHASEELPFAESRVLALVRAVDHLAPLAPHRVYNHLEEMGGARPYLDEMLEHLGAGNFEALVATKDELAAFLAEAGVAPALRDDIIAAFRAFEKYAEPIDLGGLAGEISAVDYDPLENPGTLTVDVLHSDFAQKYQVLFDYQQDQLMRVARDTGVTAESLRDEREVVMQAEGCGALVIRR